MKLSIIVPCYNEEKVIDETISALLNVTKELKTKDIEDYEIIFVDDGSLDNTFNVIKKHSNLHKEIKINALITSNVCVGVSRKPHPRPQSAATSLCCVLRPRLCMLRSRFRFLSLTIMSLFSFMPSCRHSSFSSHCSSNSIAARLHAGVSWFVHTWLQVNEFVGIIGSLY